MSTLTPAASNAFLRFGVSCCSQRDDDWVSGRMTPTCAPPPAAGAVELGAAGALEVGAAGALVVAAAGADVAAAAGVDEAGAAEVDFLLLQPAMPSPATAATATSLIAVLFMHDPLCFLGAGRAALQDCPVVVRDNICRGSGLRKGHGGDLCVRNGSVTYA